MVETVEDPQQEAQYLRSRFSVSAERLTARGRSLQMLLLDRRCTSCWGTLLQSPDGGRNVKAAEHMRRIAKQCSTTPDFIHPDMPLAEAIFRILLANGNKPMTTEDIYLALDERWVDPINPRIPTVEGVYRILSTDTFYGIVKEVPAES